MEVNSTPDPGAQYAGIVASSSSAAAVVVGDDGSDAPPIDTGVLKVISQSSVTGNGNAAKLQPPSLLLLEDEERNKTHVLKAVLLRFVGQLSEAETQRLQAVGIVLPQHPSASL